jgi:hypothetical protein
MARLRRPRRVQRRKLRRELADVYSLPVTAASKKLNVAKSNI